ncbi:hypothetical protein ACIQWA_36460 [Kitasatospora sp. NPDC098652]|uniref:hypothetical protein n=1 Tax=Kitasatospora sp. NPDC098652 TaxID=3364095 RepID=UPI0037F7B2EB
MTKTAPASVPAPRRRGPDGRFPAYRGHTCQPYTGYEEHCWHLDYRLQDDPDFRITFKRNPWCWSPELGFHRARTPHVPERLTGLTDGKFVGPKGMNMWQAVRVGAGWGTNSGGPDPARWKEQTWRVMVAVDYRWSGDLEPVAQLGRLIGALVDGGGQKRIADDDDLLRGWFRDSTREFLPHPAMGGWNDVLLRACDGQADLEQDGAWVRSQQPAPVPRRPGEPEPWEYRIDLWNNLVGIAAHPGGMRIVCEVYKLTQPSPEQAMNWMTTAVRHALRWGQVDTIPASRPAPDNEDEDDD